MNRIWRWVFLVLRLGLGALFVWAGAVKALHPYEFADDIGNYQILPAPAVMVVAFYLPWLEIVCGLAVIVERLRSGALTLLVLLMLTFTGALISARLRGLHIECGCFGRHWKGGSFGWLLVRDGAILAALLLLWTGQRRRLVAGSSGR